MRLPASAGQSVREPWSGVARRILSSLGPVWPMPPAQDRPPDYHKPIPPSFAVSFSASCLKLKALALPPPPNLVLERILIFQGRSSTIIPSFSESQVSESLRKMGILPSNLVVRLVVKALLRVILYFKLHFGFL